MTALERAVVLMRGVGTYTVLQNGKSCVVNDPDGTVIILNDHLYILTRSGTPAFKMIVSGEPVRLVAAATILHTKTVSTILGTAVPCNDETIKQMLLNKCRSDGHLAVNDPAYTAFSFSVTDVNIEDTIA